MGEGGVEGGGGGVGEASERPAPARIALDVRALSKQRLMACHILDAGGATVVVLVVGSVADVAHVHSPWAKQRLMARHVWDT